MKAIRTIMLGILLMSGIVAILSEPTSDENWFLVLFTSKLIGAILLIAVVILAQRWRKNGKIYDYEQLCDD